MNAPGWPRRISSALRDPPDSRAPVKPKLHHRADDATAIHTPCSEADIAKHIEKVNRQRRDEAERQRKAALKRAEEEARLAASIAARGSKKGSTGYSPKG